MGNNRRPPTVKRGGTRHQQHDRYRITQHAADAFRERFSHLIDKIGALDGPAVYGLIADLIDAAQILKVDRRVAEEMTAYALAQRGLPAHSTHPAAYLAESNPLDDHSFDGPVFIVTPSGTHISTVLTAQYFRENYRTAARRLAERGVPIVVPDVPPTARRAREVPPPATLAPLFTSVPTPPPADVNDPIDTPSGIPSASDVKALFASIATEPTMTATKPTAPASPLASRATSVTMHSLTVTFGELIAAALGIDIDALRGSPQLSHPSLGTPSITPPLDSEITIDWTT